MRRNTTAGTEAEVVGNEEWVNPVEKAVREVGWQSELSERARCSRATSVRSQTTRRKEVSGVREDGSALEWSEKPTRE